MELRSFNVEKIYHECVKCSFGEDLGVNKDKLHEHTDNIVSMIEQINFNEDGRVVLMCANVRKDGEVWTPYLQIVEMLIRLGKRLNLVNYNGKLAPTTIIYKNGKA